MILILDAEWKSGELMEWQFPFRTRVEGFEFKSKPTGDLLSLRIGNNEELAAERVAFPLISRPYRVNEVTSSPSEGWKISLWLMTLDPGIVLAIRTVDFSGEIRPFGIQKWSY